MTTIYAHRNPSEFLRNRSKSPQPPADQNVVIYQRGMQPRDSQGLTLEMPDFNYDAAVKAFQQSQRSEQQSHAFPQRGRSQSHATLDRRAPPQPTDYFTQSMSLSNTEAIMGNSGPMISNSFPKPSRYNNNQLHEGLPPSLPSMSQPPNQSFNSVLNKGASTLDMSSMIAGSTELVTPDAVNQSTLTFPSHLYQPSSNPMQPSVSNSASRDAHHASLAQNVPTSHNRSVPMNSSMSSGILEGYTVSPSISAYAANMPTTHHSHSRRQISTYAPSDLMIRAQMYEMSNAPPRSTLHPSYRMPRTQMMRQVRPGQTVGSAQQAIPARVVSQQPMPTLQLPMEGRVVPSASKSNEAKKLSSTGKSAKPTKTSTLPYSCQYCGKGFRVRVGLIRHHRVHTGEKPFACDLCPKRFKQKGTLTSHRRIHTGEMPYSCKSCGTKFRHVGNLRRHERRCRGPPRETRPWLQGKMQTAQPSNQVSSSTASSDCATSPSSNLIPTATSPQPPANTTM